MTSLLKQGSPGWLAARRSGIGGSEISALYTLPNGRCAHPSLTPTRLWALKTGRLPDEQPDPRKAPHLYVGRMLERPVREMYSLYSGRTLYDGRTLLCDPEGTVLLASTDGTQYCHTRGNGNEPGVYEGKVTTVFRRRDWFELDERGDQRESVPLHHVCQVQHYMACTSYSWASVVALIQGDRTPIHWRDVPRHARFIGDMRERAARWWRDHVVADAAPPVDAEWETERALWRIHREAEAMAVQLPAAFAGVFDRLEAVRFFDGMLERERQHLRNLVLSAMGPATLAVIAGDDRGWSRGKDGRGALRPLRNALARARNGSRPVLVGSGMSIIDDLYRVSLAALRPENSLHATAMHIAQLAASAAAKMTEASR